MAYNGAGHVPVGRVHGGPPPSAVAAAFPAFCGCFLVWGVFLGPLGDGGVAGGGGLFAVLVGALAGAYVVDLDCLLLVVDGVYDADVAYSDAVGGLVSLEFGCVVGFGGDGFGLECLEEFAEA